MNWLEPPQDDVERLLREGLDQAILRQGDEITHRRGWARVADVVDRPEPRARRGIFFACATAAVVLAAGAVLLPRLGVSFRRHAPVANQAVPATPTAAAVGNANGPEPSTTEQTALLEAERVPGHVVRTRAGEHARVALGGGAEAELAENSAITWDAQQRPTVVEGSALLTVPHQLPGWHFAVTAGPYVVTVIGTRFQIDVTGRTVGVEVKEGVVEVWRGARSTRLVAGDAWNGPLYPEETPGATPAPGERPHPARAAVPTDRHLLDAQAALQKGDTRKAVAILTRTAKGSGPAAQNAAYELGRIARYHLNRPRQAVSLWASYRTRFPSGLLRTEADLSIVETLAALGDVPAALGEADAFLARHPGSERRLEVQKLADRLRASESAGPR